MMNAWPVSYFIVIEYGNRLSWLSDIFFCKNELEHDDSLNVLPHVLPKKFEIEQSNVELSVARWRLAL